MTQETITFLPKKTIWALVILFFLTSGCTTVIVRPFMDPLTLALQKQTDLKLIEEGAPSLLLLLDGLIDSDPDNESFLMTGAKAYGGYASILNEDGHVDRAVNMSIKARQYGITLLKQLPGLENIENSSLDDIEHALKQISSSKVGHLFWGAYGWAVWIQYQQGAPAAMADLPIVERIMLRVVELDESYYYGGAHIFLGTYYGSRPPILGGKPEESRKHFERALALNKRKFLLTQVAYAESYARTAFDRDLYLQLLAEVIKQPLENDDLASSNKLAKVMAEKLIGQVDEFF